MACCSFQGRKHLLLPAPKRQLLASIFVHGYHIYSLWVLAGFVVGTAAILLCWLAFKFKHRISTTLKYCAIATKELARKLFIDSCEKPSTTAVTVFNPRIEYATHLLAFLDDPQPLEVIGRGGCGTVYKAELLDGSIALAVKEILPPSNGGAQVQHLPLVETKFLNHQMRQIRNEVGTVGHLRHRNILPLLAHASRPDRHYLVYEFMKNGSLHEALVAASHGSRELEWPVRYNVAVGVAMGLEYLHMEHRPQVVHRDLKPANILLDNDLNARIADFGLAKLVPDAVISGEVMSTGVAGTLGYIAPEYYQLRRFTDKCDIYSFGVILAVLVIGKFPSDPFFYMTEETCLVQWLRDVMKSENPNVAIDSRLLGNGFEREMLLVLKIACFCTNDDPRERPNSRDVRGMLFQVKNK